MTSLSTPNSVIIPLDELQGTIDLEVLGFFEGENKHTEYNALVEYFKRHGPSKNWNAVSGSESPWWPSNLYLTTLMMIRLNPRGPISEIGFGDGRVLSLLNKIFGLDFVYGCEIQPELYYWTARNTENPILWAPGSKFYRSFPPRGLYEDSPVRLSRVGLVQGDIRQQVLPDSEYYFITPTADLLDITLPKIPTGASVIVYNCYGADLERTLGKKFDINYSIQVQATNLDAEERTKADKIYLCEKK